MNRLVHSMRIPDVRPPRRAVLPRGCSGFSPQITTFEALAPGLSVVTRRRRATPSIGTPLEGRAPARLLWLLATDHHLRIPGTWPVGIHQASRERRPPPACAEGRAPARLLWLLAPDHHPRIPGAWPIGSHQASRERRPPPACAEGRAPARLLWLLASDHHLRIPGTWPVGIHQASRERRPPSARRRRAALPRGCSGFSPPITTFESLAPGLSVFTRRRGSDAPRWRAALLRGCSLSPRRFSVRHADRRHLRLRPRGAPEHR